MMLLLTCLSPMSFLADVLACWPKLVNNLASVEALAKTGCKGKCPGNVARDFMSMVLRGCTTPPIYGRWYQFWTTLQVWNKMCSHPFPWHMCPFNTWWIKKVAALMCSSDKHHWPTYGSGSGGVVCTFCVDKAWWCLLGSEVTKCLFQSKNA